MRCLEPKKKNSYLLVVTDFFFWSKKTCWKTGKELLKQRRRRWGAGSWKEGEVWWREKATGETEEAGNRNEKATATDTHQPMYQAKKFSSHNCRRNVIVQCLKVVLIFSRLYNCKLKVLPSYCYFFVVFCFLPLFELN